jgi:hypothetical protein
MRGLFLDFYGFFPEYFEGMVDHNLTKLKLFIETRRETQGLPDFSLFNIPKRGKVYQDGGKYTKWP